MPDQASPPMDPRLVGSLAPSNPMDPQAVGGLNFPFVFAPGDGTRAGHFLPRGIVPEFYAKYTPQPAPPGFEKAQHLPDSSVAYNIAQQQTQSVASSNLMPPDMPTSGGSSISASCSPYHQSPPWFCPPDFQYPEDLLGRPLTPSLGPPFLHRKQREWGIDFYIRVDRVGCYHTYPRVGGPFQGLQEAEIAIQRYLDDRRDPKMSTKDNVSAVEIAVRHYLYRPDGTNKHLRTEAVDGISDNQCHLVQALMDKYNEDNNCFQDFAYEVTEVVCYKSFCEGDVRTWYHHINFTAKAKGAVACTLFFAEVIFLQGELPVSCLCVIKPTDDGYCFSCTNSGNNLRHPKGVRYAGGHVMRTFRPFGGLKMPPGYCEDDWEAKESKFRKTLEGCDLSKPAFFPGGVANVFTAPPGWSMEAPLR